MTRLSHRRWIIELPLADLSLHLKPPSAYLTMIVNCC